MEQKRILDIWDRKENLSNRPVLSNRDIEVIKKTQELFNITIGDAISGWNDPKCIDNFLFS